MNLSQRFTTDAPQPDAQSRVQCPRAPCVKTRLLHRQCRVHVTLVLVNPDLDSVVRLLASILACLVAALAQARQSSERSIKCMTCSARIWRAHPSLNRPSAIASLPKAVALEHEPSSSAPAALQQRFSSPTANLVTAAPKNRDSVIVAWQIDKTGTKTENAG